MRQADAKGTGEQANRPRQRASSATSPERLVVVKSRPADQLKRALATYTEKRRTGDPTSTPPGAIAVMLEKQTHPRSYCNGFDWSA